MVSLGQRKYLVLDKVRSSAHALLTMLQSAEVTIRVWHNHSNDQTSTSIALQKASIDCLDVSSPTTATGNPLRAAGYSWAHYSRGTLSCTAEPQHTYFERKISQQPAWPRKWYRLCSMRYAGIQKVPQSHECTQIHITLTQIMYNVRTRCPSAECSFSKSSPMVSLLVRERNTRWL